MSSDIKALLDTLPDGLEIDITEGFRKLTRSQFGGNPGKGFGELIQNFIDSYPADVEHDERRGVIMTKEKMISITDYGSGLNLDKIKLLLTLGGTDKDQDPTKIGKFGIGFYAMLNPRLFTKKVEVITQCEGAVVNIILEIHDPEKMPVLKARVLTRNITFSTQVKVWFSTNESVEKCLAYAREVLEYYPCRVTINRKPFLSVWERAMKDQTRIFTLGAMKGFITRTYFIPEVRVLCKYEFITTSRTRSFAKGGYHLTHDLQDFRKNEIPYLPEFDVVINNDDLRLTLSRDGYYLDDHFRKMIVFFRNMLIVRFYEELTWNRLDLQVLLANIFILRDQIRRYLRDDFTDTTGEGAETRVLDLLVKAKVFPVADSREIYSILDIKNYLTRKYPLFYSEAKTNINWLGGAFKHDFILLPVKCHASNGAPFFYRDILGTIFSDVVDLETIQRDHEKIAELVKRKIVDRSALTPKCRFVGNITLNNDQRRMLQEINYILDNEEIRSVISRNINLTVNSITAAFFTVEEEGAYISTGLFDRDGVPLSGDAITNFYEESGYRPHRDHGSGDLLLGLRLDHPVITFLLDSSNRYKAYYTMTYIANELTLCQKILIPYSPVYHIVKEKLAAEMRMAMMNQILMK